MTEYDDELIVVHNGKKWEVDHDGYLEDTSPLFIKPDEDWYDYVRMREGIPELTFRHLEILEYYQRFYREKGVAPPISLATRELGWSKDFIFKLFFPSKDPIKTIIMMAGLPHPIW